MHNHFIWISGAYSESILNYLSNRSAQVHFRDEKHLLLSWHQEHDLAKHKLAVEQSDEALCLTLGFAETREAGHQFVELTPSQIWSHLRTQKGGDLAGRFATLRFSNNGSLEAATDINSGLSCYWTVIEGNFVLSSNFWLLASLLTPAARQIDLESLYETIAIRHFVAESTMLSTIKRIAPGHKVSWDEATKKVSSTPYYLWRYKVESVTEQEAQTSIEQTLLSNLEHMLKDNKNPALLLSGGVDSGTLFGMAHKLGLPPTPYTVKFAGAKYDETQKSQVIASRYGTTLNIIEANFTDMFEGALSAAQHCYDPAYNQHINIEHLVQQKIAANGHDKVWDGDFADALYGPTSMYTLSLLEKLQPIPKPIVNILMALAKKLNAGLLSGHRELWEEFGHITLEEYILQSGFSLRYSPAELGLNMVYKRSSRRDFYKKIPDTQTLDRFMISAFYFLDRVFNAKNELYERAFGLVTQKPFARAEVIHEAEKLPKHYRVQPGREKYLLKKVAENYLPQEIIYAPKVAFDAASHGKYIQHDSRWREYLNDLLHGDAHIFNWLDKAKLEATLGDLQNDESFDTFLTWRLVTLEMWFQKLAEQPQLEL